MNKELKEELKIKKIEIVLQCAKELGNDAEICRDFHINRSSFYFWKKRYEKDGIDGLRKRKPIPHHFPRKIPLETVNKILEIRKDYHLGPQRIAWYLERFHGIKVSCSTVSRTLVRHGMNRLSKSTPRRAIHTRRYSKTTPGHHIQVDVKFVWLKKSDGNKVRRFQYTAIDDATRIRALKIYKRHTQQNAIDFMNYVIDKFPFRIHTIRTDRGHEFQALFHWHVEEQGMQHIYIKPRSPQLNGKVERSHRTDQDEFYQLLTYTDDVDLNHKLAQWENFYNYHRPHTAFHGQTPYEAMKVLLIESDELSTGI